MSFEWEGLDVFIKAVEKAQVDIPSELDKLGKKVSEVVLNDVIYNTPVNKDPKSITQGNLRRGWKLRSIGEGSYEVYNDTKSKDGEYYAWDVEYGHRTRAGMSNNHKAFKKVRGTLRNKDGKIMFVPGVFMLRGAFKQGKAALELEGEKLLNKIMGDLGD